MHKRILLCAAVIAAITIFHRPALMAQSEMNCTCEVCTCVEETGSCPCPKETTTSTPTPTTAKCKCGCGGSIRTYCAFTDPPCGCADASLVPTPETAVESLEGSASTPSTPTGSASTPSTPKKAEGLRNESRDRAGGDLGYDDVSGGPSGPSVSTGASDTGQQINRLGHILMNDTGVSDAVPLQKDKSGCSCSAVGNNCACTKEFACDGAYHVVHWDGKSGGVLSTEWVCGDPNSVVDYLQPYPFGGTRVYTAGPTSEDKPVCGCGGGKCTGPREDECGVQSYRDKAREWSKRVMDKAPGMLGVTAVEFWNHYRKKSEEAEKQCK